jgi:hypothetical protein
MLSLNRSQRDSALELAKQQTYRFIYFIQTQLGFKHIGIADDEFPTKDNLPLIAYHRESRRLVGKVRFNVNHISKPFDFNLYKTGIAVGDYPIDHHHKKNPQAPQHLDFPPIPSFNVPLGSLIPNSFNGIIAAEKSISVSNVVNGTTRLQPCVLTTGQAAGVLAALAVKNKVQASFVQVRDVQEVLLNNKALIMPYIDAGINHKNFIAIQKIGATGILKGKGIPNAWANQTWFYPDSSVLSSTFIKDFEPYGKLNVASTYITIADAIKIVSTNKKLDTIFPKNKTALEKAIQLKWNEWQLSNFDLARNITRAEMAVLLDKTINPFKHKKINIQGNFIQ